MAQNSMVSAFSIVGCLTSFLLYLSPFFTFRHIYRQGTTGLVDSLPFVVTISSTILWVYYGILNDRALAILITNSFGSLAESVYIIMYIYYATPESRTSTFRRLALSAVIVPTIVLLTFFLTHGFYRVDVVGWVCTGSSVLVFLSPTYDLVRVIQARNFQLMSFWLSLTLTFCGIAWATYGVIVHDYIVVIPNVIGAALGVGQMVVYGVIRILHPNPTGAS